MIIEGERLEQLPLKLLSNKISRICWRVSAGRAQHGKRMLRRSPGLLEELLENVTARSAASAVTHSSSPVASVVARLRELSVAHMQKACVALQTNSYCKTAEMGPDKLRIALDSGHQEHEENPGRFCVSVVVTDITITKVNGEFNKQELHWL